MNNTHETRNIIKVLQVIGGAHAPVEPPEFETVFDTLLKHSAFTPVILNDLLNNLDPLFNPIRELRDAYFKDQFPKIIQIHIAPKYGGDGHALAVRIDKESTQPDEAGRCTFAISVLEALYGRNAITAHQPSAEHCDRFIVHTDEQQGIHELLKKLRETFESRWDFQKLFLKAIITAHQDDACTSDIHEKKDSLQKLTDTFKKSLFGSNKPHPESTFSLPKIDREHPINKKLRVNNQRQGSCQGKTFKRSLLTFCDSKEQYKALIIYITRAIIKYAVSLEALNTQERMRINEAIENYGRMLKKHHDVRFKGNDFHINLIPYHAQDLNTQPVTTTEEAKTIAYTFQKYTEKDLYPLIKRHTGYYDFSQYIRVTKKPFILQLIHNRILQNQPVVLKREDWSQQFFSQRPASFADIVLQAFMLLTEAQKAMTAIKELNPEDKESQRLLKQFIYERLLETFTNKSVVERFQRLSQSVHDDDFESDAIYDIWEYIQRELKSIYIEYQQSYRHEEALKDHPLINKFYDIAGQKGFNLPFDSPFYIQERFPLSHQVAKADEKIKSTPGLCSNQYKADNLTEYPNFLVLFEFWEKCSKVRELLGIIDKLDVYSISSPPPRFLKYYQTLQSCTRDPFKFIFTGYSIKEAAVVNLGDFEKTIFKQLMTLGAEQSPKQALESIVSFVITQTSNINTAFEKAFPDESEFLDKIEYINHLLKRSGALSQPQDQKTLLIEKLLEHAYIHLDSCRFMEYAILLDTANTLMHSIIKRENFQPTAKFQSLIMQHTKKLLENSHNQQPLLQDINHIQKKYPSLVIQMFYMLLSSHHPHDDGTIAAIYAHQTLCGREIPGLKNKYFRRNMALLLPFLHPQNCNPDVLQKLGNWHADWRCKLVTSTAEFQNPQFCVTLSRTKKEFITLIPPNDHSHTQIGQHYLQSSKKLRCPDPVRSIKENIGIEVPKKSLKFNNGHYHFSYRGRQYSIGPNKNIFLTIAGESYQLILFQGYSIFKHTVSGELIAIIPQVPSHNPLKVEAISKHHYKVLHESGSLQTSSEQGFFSSLYHFFKPQEQNKEETLLSYQDRSEHHILSFLGRVIKIEDKLYFPQYDFLLHYSPCKQYLYSTDIEGYSIPITDSNSQKYPDLENGKFCNYLVFQNSKQEKRLCLFVNFNKYVYCREQANTLIPNDYYGFSLFIQYLLKSPSSQQSAVFALHALPYFSGTHPDATALIKEIMKSRLLTRENFSHPQWLVFFTQLLKKIPNIQLDPEAKKDVGEVLNYYLYQVGNFSQDEIDTLSLKKFEKFLSTNAYLQIYRLSTMFLKYRPSFNAASSKETALSYVEKGVDRILRASKSELTEFPQKDIPLQAYGITDIPSIAPAIQLPVLPPNIQLWTNQSVAAPVFDQAPSSHHYVLGFSNNSLLDYNDTLPKRIEHSIDQAKDEITHHKATFSQFVESLPDHIHAFSQNIQRDKAKLKKQKETCCDKIIQYCKQTLHPMDLASRQINLRTLLSHELIHIEKLIQLGGHPIAQIEATLGITKENAQALKKALQYYLFISNEHQFLSNAQTHFARYQQDPQDQDNLKQLFLLLSIPRSEDLYTNPNYYQLLQYEYYSGFRARPGQTSFYQEIVEATLENKKPFISELKPGAGKTSILPSIAVSQTFLGKQVVVVLPPALYTVQSHEIEQTVTQYGLRCYHLQRLPKLQVHYLSELVLELKHCQKEQAIILSNIQEIQALKLQAVQFKEESNTSIIQELLSLLDQFTYLIDEVDQELSPLKTVNIAIGEREPIAKELQQLVAESMCYISQANPEKLHTYTQQKSYHGLFPEDTTLSEEELSNLIEKTIQAIPRKFTRLHERIESFIKMSHPVIFMSKNAYARSPKNHFEGVPAIGGVATPNASFSDPITRLITTWLVTKQQGLQKHYLRQLVCGYVETIIDCNRNNIKFERTDRLHYLLTHQNYTKNLSAKTQAVIQDILDQSRCVHDEEDAVIDTVVDLILELESSEDAYLINSMIFSDYVQKSVFPRLSMCSHNLSLGPFDRPDAFGTTGTTHLNKALEATQGEFPINQSVKGRLSGDGNTLYHLLTLEREGTLSFVSYNDFASSPATWNKKYSAIIDQAKFVTPSNTKEYIKKLFSDLPTEWDIHCILFFIENDFYGYCHGQFYQIPSTKKQSIEEITNVPMKNCFMLFDSARTRGCDIPLAADAHALLTVDINTKLDDLIQSAMRLRKLGEGQSLSIVLSHSLAEALSLGEEQTGHSVERLIQFLAHKDQCSFESLEFVNSGIQAVQATLNNFVQAKLLSASPEDSQKICELFMTLLQQDNRVLAEHFSKAVSNISVEERLRAVSKEKLSLIEQYFSVPDSIIEKIDTIIHDKIRISAPTVQSIYAKQVSQIEVNVDINVDINTQHRFQQSISFNCDTAEKDYKFKKISIARLYPEIKSKNLFISENALKICRQNQGLAKDLSMCFLLIEGESVTIATAEEADNSDVLQTHQKLLSSDFSQMLTFPRNIQKTLFLATTCLGQGLALTQFLTHEEIDIPEIATWAKQANNFINIANKDKLEAQYKSKIQGATTKTIQAIEKIIKSEKMSADTISKHIESLRKTKLFFEMFLNADFLNLAKTIYTFSNQLLSDLKQGIRLKAAIEKSRERLKEALAKNDILLENTNLSKLRSELELTDTIRALLEQYIQTKKDFKEWRSSLDLEQKVEIDTIINNHICNKDPEALSFQERYEEFILRKKQRATMIKRYTIFTLTLISLAIAATFMSYRLILPTVGFALLGLTYLSKAIYTWVKNRPIHSISPIPASLLTKTVTSMASAIRPNFGKANNIEHHPSI